MKRVFCAALALLLALGCASAFAETAEEFINGPAGYNYSMPYALSAMGISADKMDDAVELFTLSYDAEATETMGLTTYSAGSGIFYVIFADPANPYREFYFGTNALDADNVEMLVTPFVFHLARKLGAEEGAQIGEALNWFGGEYVNDPEVELMDCHVSYMGEGTTIFRFERG